MATLAHMCPLVRSLTRRLVSAYIRTMVLKNGTICIIWLWFFISVGVGSAVYLAVADECLQAEISLGNFSEHI